MIEEHEERRGYLRATLWNDVVVNIHWSTPLGAFILGHFAFVPAFWLGVCLIIFIHEVGHAAMVWMLGGHVDELEVDGAGGRCTFYGELSEIDHALIAWGGVLAQAVLLALTYLLLQTLGSPRSIHWKELAYAFTRINVLFIAFNLLPVRSLDGKEAWPLIPILYEKLRSTPSSKSKVGARQAKTKMTEKSKAKPVDPAVAAAKVEEMLDSLKDKVMTEETKKSKSD